MPEKNATLVVKLHKWHIFEKAPSSISDVTKETLHEEELAGRAQGNEKFKLKKLNVLPIFFSFQFHIRLLLLPSHRIIFSVWLTYLSQQQRALF